MNKEALTILDAPKSVRACLRDYAQARQHQGVGQFIDAEGRAVDHKGIYGIAGWLILSSGKVGADSEVLSGVTSNCKDILLEWVRRARNTYASTSTLSEDNHTEAWEVAFIIPKIATSLQALSDQQNCHDEAVWLRNRLLMAQHADTGGWGYLAGHGEPDPLATAIVLRTVKASYKRSDNFDRKAVHRAIVYLDGVVSKGLATPYHELFVLNALFRSTETENEHQEIASRAAQHIRRAISRVHM